MKYIPKRIFFYDKVSGKILILCLRILLEKKYGFAFYRHSSLECTTYYIASCGYIEEKDYNFLSYCIKRAEKKTLKCVEEVMIEKIGNREKRIGSWRIKSRNVK